jgi:hypothetical protein
MIRQRAITLGQLAVALMAIACGDDEGGGGGGSGAAAGAGGAQAGAGAGNTGGTLAGTGGSAAGGTGGTSGTSGGSSGSGGSAGQMPTGGSAGAAAGTGGSSGGSAAQGGSAGASAGTAGAAAMAGTGGNAGTAGTGTTSCTISATHTVSEAIPTVGIVTFTTDLSAVTAARIEFGLDTSYGMEAPVDLTEPNYRTLLLGMKQRSDYHYRVVASSAAGECASEDYTLTTESLPNSLPDINVTGKGTGFLHSCFFGLMGGGALGAFILDSDGEYVWYGGTGEMGRAEIHPDNKYMYYASVSPQGTGGTMRRIRLDSTDEEDLGSAFSGIHHDFTILEDGTIAFIRRVGSDDWVAEWKDGTTENLFNVTEMFGEGNPHVNSIHYNPGDDSYTLSDRNYNAYVKSTRAGVKQWKLGGSNSSFTGDVTWNVNHGHQMIGDTGILFFNNGNSGASSAIELTLDLDSMVATEVWTYSPNLSSSVLGDVQILENGNRVITFSTSGVIDEVRPSDMSIVQSLEFDAGGAVGYSTKRESLYGPPPR